jgi:hypothetical protein
MRDIPDLVRADRIRITPDCIRAGIMRDLPI